MNSECPIVVDLDGTLLCTDLLWETASIYVLAHPRNAFRMLKWLLRGKACLKERLAESTHIATDVLPYNEALLQWLSNEKASGRVIVLATASHRILAEQVANELKIFDEVIATEGDVNLKSEAKRRSLVDRYGERGFDYVGNDWADVPVWKSARLAHVVGGSTDLLEVVTSDGNLAKTFVAKKQWSVSHLLRATRPHQWLKNFLVFIPLFAAHRYFDLESLFQSFLAFVVFGLVASGVYLLNDIADVQSDRHHAYKRYRPMASGELGLLIGWAAWPSLIFLSFLVAMAWLSWDFVFAVASYFVLTLAYSLCLKRMALLDVICLAGLYTLRIIAGAAAIGVSISFWLLAFSLFFFLSLAFIKRYSELMVARNNGTTATLRGRGYRPQDLEFVSTLGGNAGYLSVLVLALYIQDGHTAHLYAQPKWIWLACPLLLWWISRVWLIAHRGGMNEDPIIFALKDRVSWGVLFSLAIVFILAKVS